MTTNTPRSTWEELPASTEQALAAASISGASGSFPETTRQEMLRLLGVHPDLAYRSCLPGHLTGSALVIEEGTERFALMLHTKLRRWLQPGGHADGDTNLARVALREASEETGIDGLRVVDAAIDLDIHEVADKAIGPHLHLDVRYLVLAPRGAAFAANEESLEMVWAEERSLDAYDPDEGLRRLVRSGLERARG